MVNNYAPYIAGAAGGAGIGGLFGNLFGGNDNPADAANKYFNQIPAELQKYLSPYINAGQGAFPQLQGQYGNLLNDPGGMLNKIGQGYQQSPGFKFALQQALGGAGNAAAAGGMAGSPQHEQQNMGIATNLANQDYNQYLQNAMGMYNQGLAGEQGLYNTGAQAGMGMGEDLATLLQNQGKLAYEGQAGQNQANSSMWSNLFGGAGAALPFLFK
jgi:uncharacterized protein YcfJ